jgi:Carboxypeptidase regulatory-like domain/TonB-dependent Receptor Plug Domain
MCRLWVLVVLCSPALAQTTQGILLGRITDSVTGRAISSASVSCISESTSLVSPASVDDAGNYAIASLSPGRYVVTITAPQYQTQQARSLEMPVAGRAELNIRLRPLYDVWEAGQYRSWRLPESQQTLGYYGPDVDTSRVAIFNANTGIVTPLENSLSSVLGPVAIDNLPLVGRDVYSLLVLLPGVTSDTTTARGLGFSVDGQRPSSSNYLLDGAENNNLLVTGPLSTATPEFIQEYRVSTANYSAEYGRTSGFIANAVTRNGTNQWHAKAFYYFENDRLDGNGFQENAHGIARPAFTQNLPGVVVSGPLIRDRLFFAAGFEALQSHGSDDPQTFALPTTSFINSTDPNSYAGQLLRRYQPYASPSGSGDFGLASITAANGYQRSDSYLRTDYTLSSSEQLFGRFALDHFEERDLLGSPYPAFAVPYRQASLSIVAGLISRLGATSQNEFHASRSGDSLGISTANAGVPTLVDDQRDSTGQYEVTLPGNPSAYDYKNRGRTWELLDNWTWVGGRHAIKIGGGFLQRDINLNLNVYPQGYLEYATLSDFAQNQIENLLAESDSLSATHGPVSPLRSYRYRQWDGFAQDSFHASSRLTLDYGVRYDYFGSPVNTGVQKDLLIQLAPGSDIENSIAGATEMLQSASGSPAVYTSRPSNWAFRGGVAWDPFGSGRTVVRASYGIFYDRLFDNLWENVIQNRFSTGVWTYTQPVSLPAPLAQLEGEGQAQMFSPLITALAFQPYLRTPRTQSAYIGVQQSLSPDLFLEVHGLASHGRQLITTDEVNRPFSLPTGLLNPAIGNYIDYRANQGSSDYAGLVTALRIRKARFNGQVSYTWSHSIDNQSEPLNGTFFDFNTLSNANQGGYQYISSFTQQFASGADRGNSDFDQRNNFVFFLTYQTPPVSSSRRVAALLRNWTVSALGAVRSGLPYTVYSNFDASSTTPEYFVNERANLVDPQGAYTSQPVSGGRLLLNAAAFSLPGPNMIGSSGRNEFTGPGLFSTDASIARAFPLPALRETARLVVRSDFYNLVNHANLNNPASYYGVPGFGVAAAESRPTMHSRSWSH